MKCDDENTALIKGLIIGLIGCGLLASACKRYMQVPQRADHPGLSQSQIDESRANPPSIPAPTFFRYALAFTLGTFGAVVTAVCGCHELSEAIEHSKAPDWVKSEFTDYSTNIIFAMLAGLLGVLLVNKACDAAQSLVAWTQKRRGESAPLLTQSPEAGSDMEAGPSSNKDTRRRISCNIL